MKILKLTDAMFARLLEHIHGCDYCYLCDCHPGDDDTRHDRQCPLLRKEPAAVDADADGNKDGD